MEYLGTLLTKQACLRISWNALGCLAECSWQAPGAPSKHGNLTLKIVIFEALRGPREVKIGPQRPLGPFLERLGLMDASWSALAGLLERSWTALGPKKRSLERLLAAPRGIPREVSAILTAKRLPKRRPKWHPKTLQVACMRPRRSKRPLGTDFNTSGTPRDLKNSSFAQ